ncbi:MAG: hypothetical protein HQL94_01660, partial [Magnetococcales bacterium]|nr:hypothetical protein [Magnetococcales bacterium]
LAAGLFTWRARLWQQRLAHDLNRLCRMLTDRMTYITGERLSYDQLHATRQLQAQMHHSPTAPPTLSLEPLTRALREEGNKLSVTLQNQGAHLAQVHDSMLSKLDEFTHQRTTSSSLQDSQMLANIATHLDLAASLLEKNSATHENDSDISTLADLLRQDGAHMLEASHVALEQIATVMVSMEHNLNQTMSNQVDILAQTLREAGQHQANMLEEIVSRVQTLVEVTPKEKGEDEANILRETARQMEKTATMMAELGGSINLDGLRELLLEEGERWSVSSAAAMSKAIESLGLSSLPDAMEQMLQLSSTALEDAIRSQSQQIATASPELMERLELGILRTAENRAGVETELMSRIALQLTRAVEALETQAAGGQTHEMERLFETLQQEGERWTHTLADRLELMHRESTEEIRGTLEQWIHWQGTLNNRGEGGVSDNQIHALVSGLRQEGESLAQLHRQALEEVLMGMETVRARMDGAFELSTESLARALNAEGERVIDARPDLLEHLESSILMQAEARADAENVLLGRIAIQMGRAVEALEDQARNGPPPVDLVPLIDTLHQEINRITTLQQENMERVLVEMGEKLTAPSGHTDELLTKLLQDRQSSGNTADSSTLERMATQLERTVQILEEGFGRNDAIAPLLDSLRTDRENLAQVVAEMGSNFGTAAMMTLMEGLREGGDRAAQANAAVMDRVVLGLETVAIQIDRTFEKSTETLSAAVRQESSNLINARPEILERLEAGILQQAEARLGVENQLLDHVAIQLSRVAETLESRAMEAHELTAQLETLRSEGETWTSVLATRLADGQKELFANLKTTLESVIGKGYEQTLQEMPELLTELQTRSEVATSTALEPLVSLVSRSNEQMVGLQRQILEQMATLFSSLENRLAGELSPSVKIMPPLPNDDTTLSLDPSSLQPFMDGLRREGQNLARELGHYLLQTVVSKGTESAPMLMRSEQESWMRIIDRMERAALALEQQATGLTGLKDLATQTRRASESLLHSGQEAVENLLESVENFNVRMEGAFARSADALLDRLALTHQEIITRVLEGLGENRNDETSSFLQGVANQLETAMTDSSQSQRDMAQLLEPLMDGLRQEGERLLEAGDAAMRHTLSAVNLFHEQMEQSLQGSMENMTSRLTQSQRELGEQLATALTQLIITPPTAKTETVEPMPAPVLPISDTQEMAMEQIIQDLKSHYPKLAHLDTNQIVKEAIERLNALLGHGDKPTALEAYPALMELRQQVRKVLQEDPPSANEINSEELPKRIAALILSWEEPVAQSTPMTKPPIQESAPPVTPPPPKVENSPIQLPPKVEKTSKPAAKVVFSKPVSPMPTIHPERFVVVTDGQNLDKNLLLPLVDRYLHKRQRPQFHLVKAVWSHPTL